MLKLNCHKKIIVKKEEMVMNTILIIGAVCTLATGQCNVVNNASSYSTNRANNITYDGFDVLYRSKNFLH